MGRADRENTFSIIGKKSRNISISNASELLDYKIGSSTRSVSHKLVVKSGVDPAKIKHSSTTLSLAKLLELERVDLWACEENTALWVLEQAGLDSREYEAVYVLKELDMYIALNINTPKRTVDSLQQAVDDVMAIRPDTGRSDFQDIVARYLPE